MTTAWCFDHEQLLNAARLYVENGPEISRTLRQQDVDGALMFLGSDQAKKLRPVGREETANA